MGMGQLGLRLARTDLRERDVGAVVGAVENPCGDELFEQRVARGAIQLPEATRLRQRQSQPRHLLVLGSNPGEVSTVKSRSAHCDYHTPALSR